jgi:purine-binding chemotaxis protein CheW
MTAVHVRLRVGSERYALPIESVREVAELGELSAVPGAGHMVLGVRNLHGQLLPVFDLARVLAIAADPSRSRIVVTEHNGHLAGLAVDEVTDVEALPGDDQETEADHLSGAVLDDGQLVGIIDVHRLFGALAGATS